MGRKKTIWNPQREAKLDAFDRLLTIMSELRENCPWDKKQTWQSLRPLTIEEVYELADAVSEDHEEEVKKELGDLMLHIVFYAQIASEKKAFDIADVLETLCEKLIIRHPHIYGNEIVNNVQDVEKNWEKIKSKEGNRSILQGIPKSSPAMNKAMAIQNKVRKVGFEWRDKEEVLEKVLEEIKEFIIENQQRNNQEKTKNELGDIFFSLINYARFIGIDPEHALESTNRKFIRRFQRMEELSGVEGKKITNMTLEEMDTYWNKTKAEEG